MTTLTGSTKATLAGTVDPPTIFAALSGAVVQISTLTSVWYKYTSLGSCVPDPRQCVDDPWARQVLMTVALCLGLWAYSLRSIPSTGTSDPSIVDRLWSVLPAIYCWHWYLSAPSSRLLLMTLIVTVWGVRLTWNFALKGGFSGGEDYRWAEIRTWPGFDRGWEAFNLLFICGFQQLVVLAFTSPAAAVIMSKPPPLNALDAFAALLFLALVAGEAIADRQQLRFQTEKYRRIRAKELPGEYADGFISTGLWAYSRHPNYFCEVTMWCVFYLFTIAAGMPLLNWTALGPIFFACLFVLPHASLDTTEALSSRKYPNFPDYQRRVSRFFPLPPRPDVTLPPMRAVDCALICWFVIGTLITYLIDMEQVGVQHGVQLPRRVERDCISLHHLPHRHMESLYLCISLSSLCTPSISLHLPPSPSHRHLTFSALDACLSHLAKVLVKDPAKYGQARYLMIGSYYKPLPTSLHTPIWPPQPCVRAVHWWGGYADPLVMARPVWFQVAIWLEVFVQAPFYVLAIYAFARQRNWIRIPAIVYATVLLTIMPIVLGEQYYGEHATPKPLLVTAVYSAYVVMPLLIIARVWSPDVFSPAGKPLKPPAASPAPSSARRRAASPAKSK